MDIFSLKLHTTHLVPKNPIPIFEDFLKNVNLTKSRVDYCNSLLYGLPAYQFDKLQRVQNAAARLIFQESKYCHVRPLLYNLHWLPVKFRIDFKILLLTYKAINGLAPFYLQELISLKEACKYKLYAQIVIDCY